jgi:tetratricopeptide (TPR) repeat protein
LPDGLTAAERDFVRELRRVVDVAGLSCRALQEATQQARTRDAEGCFYSKSQWARWLNGHGLPPRRAVRRLAEVLAGDAAAAYDPPASDAAEAGTAKPAAEPADAADEVDDVGTATLRRLWARAAGPAPAQGPASGQALGPGQAPTPDSASGYAAPPPRQVPSVTPHFTNRETELAALDALADQAAARRGPLVVVIAGTAGVGKSTLANYFARRAAARFPDGQLHVNLRGFDTPSRPLDGSAALRGFLEALGVQPAAVPTEADAQAALYRSLVADRSLLIVLDNASDLGQVRRLIPGGQGCLVVVTSRNYLAGLLAQGAQVLTLAPFNQDDALRFLARRLTTRRVEREPRAAADLIRMCARLPLAISVAAAHAATHPALSLSALAAELRRRRLDVLDTGDAETSARTVFSWSYQSLSERAARLFRLLSVHPGPDVSVAAAASLAALPVAQARAALRELARAHLAEEHKPGRFAVHDLLRVYAAEQALAVDGEASLREADLRLLDHYLRTGHAGALLLAPARDCGELPPPRPGAIVDPPASEDAALAWFTAERRPLLAAAAHAAERGLVPYCWQLPWVMSPYLIGAGHWVDFAATQRAALAAAEAASDQRGAGHALYLLAYALDLSGDGEGAEAHLRRALEVFTETGDEDSQGLVLHGIAHALQTRGELEAALPIALEALRLRSANGSAAVVAATENAVGALCARLGLHQLALTHCRSALAAARAAGARLQEGDALSSLGLAYSRAGDHEQAAACYEEAVATYRELGDLPYLAAALTALGDAQAGAGDDAAARESHAAARRLLAAMPPPDASKVQAWAARDANSGTEQ